MLAKQNCDQTTESACPFLRLPAEVRIQIYRYLIPDVPVPAWFSKYRQSPLRRDGQPCCSAILRTSRTIYREVLAEWYGAVEYSIFMDYHGIYCFDSKFRPYFAPLPSAFQAVKSLDLSIELTGYAHICAPHSLDTQTYTYRPQFNFQDCVGVLVNCLKPGRGKLRRLRLHLSAGLSFFYHIKKHRDEVIKTLEWNLAPLWNLRGLSEVSIDLCISKTVTRIEYRSQPLLREIEYGFKTAGRDLLNALEREISSAPTDAYQTYTAFMQHHSRRTPEAVYKWNTIQ